jgi:hypothetical protein
MIVVPWKEISGSNLLKPVHTISHCGDLFVTGYDLCLFVFYIGNVDGPQQHTTGTIHTNTATTTCSKDG